MESVWTLLNSLNFIYQTFFTETFFWKRRTEKPETRNEWERTNFEFWYSSSWWWDARKSEMESHQIQHIIIIVISSVRQIKKSTKMCLLLYMYLYIKLYIYNIHIKLFAKKWARGFDHALASREFFFSKFWNSNVFISLSIVWRRCRLSRSERRAEISFLGSYHCLLCVFISLTQADEITTSERVEKRRLRETCNLKNKKVEERFGTKMENFNHFLWRWEILLVTFGQLELNLLDFILEILSAASAMEAQWVFFY